MKTIASRREFPSVFSSYVVRTLVLFLLLFIATRPFCAAQEPEKSGSQRPRDRTFREELLSPENLDTGDYKGLITRDPDGKGKYTGFVYIPTVTYKKTPLSRTPSTTRSPASSRLIDTVEDLKGYSPIAITIDEPVPLDSPRLLKYPLLIIDGLDGELTESEIRIFSQYLKSGGFVIIGYLSRDSDRKLKEYIGRDSEIKPLPTNHFIYSCYYDLTNETGRLTGIWVDGTLTGVFFRFQERIGITYRPSEQNRNMGINIIVYSLLREGSVAKKGR